MRSMSGPLFAIHLDGHERTIDQRRNLLVLERFALHHVAPVAGGIADGKEDRLILAARLFERFVAPRIPVHGVVGVLPEVGALLVARRFVCMGLCYQENMSCPLA